MIRLKDFIFNAVIVILIVFMPIVLVSANLSDSELKNGLILILLVVYPCLSLIFGMILYRIKTNIYVSIALNSVAYVAVFPNNVLLRIETSILKPAEEK